MYELSTASLLSLTDAGWWDDSYPLQQQYYIILNKN